MKKPGGIIALIGGIFGTIAAIVTLFAGGLVAGLEGASAAIDGSAVDNAASSQIASFAILGLNPHNFATVKKLEEKEIILPAVNTIKKSGIKVVGPISPDTNFLLFKK